MLFLSRIIFPSRVRPNTQPTQIQQSDSQRAQENWKLSGVLVRL